MSDFKNAPGITRKKIIFHNLGARFEKALFLEIVQSTDAITRKEPDPECEHNPEIIMNMNQITPERVRE